MEQIENLRKSSAVRRTPPAGRNAPLPEVLEKTLKKNDSIFNTYCAIKELIKDEPISVDYVQSEEDTLLKNLMRKNLNSDEYVEFEKLLDEAGINAWREQVDFLGRGDGMIEHIRCEYGIDKRRFSV